MTATFVAGTCLIGALFALGTLGRAQQKLFWHDEIFTAVVAALPAREVWAALRDGVDLSPPGFHVLTRVSHAVFGAGLVGTRIPAALGVLAAAICAGVFVRRRCGVAAGFAGMLLLLCTDAYLYAYEARPYGVVLGLAGAALVCWQSATMKGDRRAIWLAGVAVSLAAALTCHYYAVLLYVPIAAGELDRTIRARRPDWPMWVAVVASTLPLVFLRPLIQSVRQYSAGYFAPPSLRTVFDSYESAVSQVAIPLLLTAIASGTVVIFDRLERDPREHRAGDPHEWVAAVAFVLLPFVAYALAAGWTNALEPRYFLPWTIGFSILVPFMIVRLSPYRQGIAVALAGALFLWFGSRQALSARWLAHKGPDLRSAYPLLFEGTTGDLPIVIGHPHVFLVATYYAGPPLQSRLVTLTPAGGNTTNDSASDTAIRGFRALQKRIPLRLEPFDTFTARHPRFFVYGPSSSDPVVAWLRERGAVLVLRGEDPDTQRFPMSRPGPYSLFEVTLRSPAAAVRDGS